MDKRERFVEARIEVETVDAWIEAGWIEMRPSAGAELSEIDQARARLIYDLTHNLGVNDEGVPIILDLIDQMHGLRRAMRELLDRRRA